MTNAARKPGERWLEPEDGLGLWAVYECGDDGRTLTVAAHQYRADALLLVHGRGLVEFAQDCIRNYDHEECYHRDGSAGRLCRRCKAEAVLADMEGGG